jgi:hypothetical protein
VKLWSFVLARVGEAGHTAGMQKKRVIGGLIGLLLVAVVLAIVVLFIYPTNAQREHRPRFGPDESETIWGTHVGKSREELIAQLGEPTEVGPWLIGMPRQLVFDKHPGLQTLEWHWPSGQFLASVNQVDGRWICFASCWVPKGWGID